MQWLKGHGTENDFILVPDHDARLELEPEFVAALCHRRRGLGADGVLRVVRSAAARIDSSAEWFMDYRNADGSLAEMCGNGMRVFARHLVDAGLVTSRSFTVATRAGDKSVQVHDDGTVSVDMGPYVLGAHTRVSANGQTWSALEIHTGNPHAVVFVDSLHAAGTLAEPPTYDTEVFPHGVNIEFVERIDDRHATMRVHERGSGETRSCGTGTCAVAIAQAHAQTQSQTQSSGLGTHRVDVLGGTLLIEVEADRTVLTGPAEIVASGDLVWAALGVSR